MRISKRIPEIVGLLGALVLAAGCDSLNISNPNDPDRTRALSDPASIPSIALGAFQTWYLTTQGGFGEDQYPALTLSVMARSHVAMWNNFNIRFYTGCTTDWTAGGYPAPLGTCGKLTEGPAYPRVEWQNNLASAQRTQIEAMWYGYYASLSSANSVLAAMRLNHISVPDSAMVETMAVLSQALALSGIALNYDQGFIVDFNSDLSALTLSNRTQMRDAALAKFDEAIAEANANTFVVPPTFFGSPAVSYDNVKVAQIGNTMAARLLVYFPRDAAENATVDWAKVAGYASKGISSGTAFNLTFHQDGCITWCDFLKVWSNDMTTMRIHTRVAHMMDPATQPDPWDITLNTNPASPDKRLGDGTSREPVAYDTTVLRAYPDSNCAKPVGCTGGSDYVWTHTKQFGNTTRGAWHQSAVGQIRYDSLTTCGDNPQGQQTGAVDAPMVLAAENDLIWAEALIRGSTPDPATAATLINKTRVGRGGLTPATAGDANLLQELQYEQDVELPGSNIAPFYNQRRIDNLEPLTPHEMPVPAKELGVLRLCSGSCYTWGGASNPPNSNPTAPAPSAAVVMQRAPLMFEEMMQAGRGHMMANRIFKSLNLK